MPINLTLVQKSEFDCKSVKRWNWKWLTAPTLSSNKQNSAQKLNEDWNSLAKFQYKYLITKQSATSMSNTPKLSRFVWGTLRIDTIRTLRLNSIRTELRFANRLPAWRIDNRGNDSCRFDSNRQHFQPTLYSPPEVAIVSMTTNCTSLAGVQFFVVFEKFARAFYSKLHSK